jgi:hypothetical protein
MIYGISGCVFDAPAYFDQPKLLMEIKRNKFREAIVQITG